MPDGSPNLTKAYIAWALGSLGFYYAWFHRVLPSVMVDRLMADFAVSGAILGTLSALYFYAYAALQLPVGAMVDRWGPGVPYASALILAALGSALFATTNSIELAYLGRIMIGVGCAFGWVAALKIIALFFPPARFAMLSGAGMCIGLSGGFSGQMIAGTMVDAFGWRVTMWGMAASGTVLSLAVFTLVSRRGPTTGDSAPPPTMKEIFTSFGIALRQLQVWLVAGGGAIASAPLFVFGSLWGIPYLMQFHDLSRPHAASLTAMMLIGWGLGALFSGWLSDKVGQRRQPLLIGLFIAFAALVIAIYVPDLSPTLIGALMLVNGLASGVIVLTYAMAGDLAPENVRGSTFAFANMLIILSGAVFQPLSGWLLDLNWTGIVEDGVRVYEMATYETMFLIVPASYVVGIAMIMMSRNTGKTT